MYYGFVIGIDLCDSPCVYRSTSVGMLFWALPRWWSARSVCSCFCQHGFSAATALPMPVALRYKLSAAAPNLLTLRAVSTWKPDPLDAPCRKHMEGCVHVCVRGGIWDMEVTHIWTKLKHSMMHSHTQTSLTWLRRLVSDSCSHLWGFSQQAWWLFPMGIPAPPAQSNMGMCRVEKTMFLHVWEPCCVKLIFTRNVLGKQANSEITCAPWRRLHWFCFWCWSWLFLSFRYPLNLSCRHHPSFFSPHQPPSCHRVPGAAFHPGIHQPRQNNGWLMPAMMTGSMMIGLDFHLRVCIKTFGPLYEPTIFPV